MSAVTRERTETGWRISICEPRLLVSKNDALQMKFLDGFRKAAYAGSVTVFRHVYNDHAARLVEVVIMAARPIGRVPVLVDLRISFCPSRQWDDDAGAILATWVVDGLTRAGLWSKDRRVIRWLSVQTIRDVPAPAIVVEIERVPS